MLVAIRRILTVAAFAAMLAACVSFPLTDPVVVEGRRLDAAAIAFLQKNETPVSEVVGRLGRPMLWVRQPFIAIYGATLDQRHFVAGYIQSGEVRMRDREALFVAFDDGNRVLHWGHAQIPWRATWRGAALDWAHAAGMQVPPRGKAFAELTVPDGQSVVYFYCPMMNYPTLGITDVFLGIYSDEPSMLGELREKEYLAIAMDPGKRRISVEPYLPLVSRVQMLRGSIELDLQPGSVHFVEMRFVRSETGYVAEMQERSRQEALPAVRAFVEAW